MKKLLLILALLAYVAISCDDKPTNLTDDGTNTENPTVADKSADTCKLSFITTHIGTPVLMVYKTSSSNVDFESSVNSIFKHFTITLKNGNLDTAIYTNTHSDKFTFPSDTGFIDGAYQVCHFDSIKYGNYLIVLWKFVGGSQWSANYYNVNQTFLYRDITFDSESTDETISFDDVLWKMLTNANPLTFTRF